MINVSPVQIVLFIVSVMPLTIDGTLLDPLPIIIIRQQLVEAKKAPSDLVCPSTAPQLNHPGWT